MTVFWLQDYKTPFARDHFICCPTDNMHFCQRTKRHQNDIKNKRTANGFYAHLRKNKGHLIDWPGGCFFG